MLVGDLWFISELYCENFMMQQTFVCAGGFAMGMLWCVCHSAIQMPSMPARPSHLLHGVFVHVLYSYTGCHTHSMAYPDCAVRFHRRSVVRWVLVYLQLVADLFRAAGRRLQGRVGQSAGSLIGLLDGRLVGWRVCWG